MGRKTISIACVIGAVLIWGSTFVVSKMALEEVGPFTLGAARFAVACLIAVPIALKGLSLRSLPWKSLVAFGAMGGALFFALQNAGMNMTSATSTSLIQATIPAFTSVFSRAFLGERLGLKKVIGTIVSVIGAALIVLLTKGPVFLGGSTLGNLLVFGSAAAWATYTILVKGAAQRISSLAITAGTNLFGLVLLLPATVAEVASSDASLSAVSPGAWISMVYLGAMGSGVAYMLWNKGLEGISASQAGVFVNLSPVVSVTFARLFLGEEITYAHVIGGLTIISGAAMTTARSAPADDCKRS